MSDLSFVLVDETSIDWLLNFEWSTPAMQGLQRAHAVKREVEARQEIDERTVTTSRGLRYTTDLHADPRWGGRNPTLLGPKDTRRRVSTRRVLP